MSQLEHLMKENPEVQFSTHDLEEDFDPEAHDRLMKVTVIRGEGKM